MVDGIKPITDNKVSNFIQRLENKIPENTLSIFNAKKDSEATPIDKDFIFNQLYT